MDLEDLKDKFSELKSKLPLILICFVIGLIFGIIIFMEAMSFLLFFQIVNLILTSFLFLKFMSRRSNPNNPKTKIKKTVCPECGSPARHKKNCSRGKKK